MSFGLGQIAAAAISPLTAGTGMLMGSLSGIGQQPSADPSQSSAMMAQLYRDQWSDYTKNYAPVEDQLINDIKSGKRMDDALNNASNAVNNQYDSAAGNIMRRRSGYGLSTALTPAEQRQLALSKATTNADLQNRTRLNVENSNLNIIGGASSGAGVG